MHVRYEWSSEQSVIHLQMQLEYLKIHKGESIIDVIGAFVSLKAKMEAIGEFLSERELSTFQTSILFGVLYSHKNIKVIHSNL